MLICRNADGVHAGPALAGAGPLWPVVWLRHRGQSTVLWLFWWR